MSDLQEAVGHVGKMQLCNWVVVAAGSAGFSLSTLILYYIHIDIYALIHN